MAKRTELSAVAVKALEALKNSEKALTLAELKELVPELNPAHLTALRNRELVNAEEVEVEYVTVSKRKVLSYAAKEVEVE